MIRLTHSLRVVIGFGLASALTACASHSPAQVDNSNPSAALRILQTLPASGSITADDFVLMQLGDWREDVVDDHGHIVDHLVYTRTATTRYGAAIQQAEAAARTAFWKKDDQDNVVMPAVIEFSENVISRFDPPLIIAFKELHAGEELIAESSMKVLDLKNPTKVRETGKATRTMKYVGDCRLVTPAGEFTAKQVEVRFAADLRLADAAEYTIQYVVPGLGVVAETSTESRKVLGAFGDSKRRTLVLHAPPP